ncbi:MAG: SUMF1/EgtB/PvdO family nonheme iron enzyme [Sedimentisphaerales bacterium]|nr:SUMF1/EgtB/PvdO family nonheme iron enzyme [Sedimentisphaerales bacterium]
MKKLIVWLVCFFIGCGLIVVAGCSSREAAQSKIAGATRENPFVNSLGMKFVPVPGTKVLISVWDTRVEDFHAYAKATDCVHSGGMMVMKVKKNDNGSYGTPYELDKEVSWKNPGFKQEADHPVVGVSWEDAKAFCAWLTKKERKAGRIGAEQEYRLPTDAEWSAAAGDSNYPWGNEWPLPKGAGNYADEAFVAKLPKQEWAHVPGNDGYERTSPVGAFKANRLGLYDMGGNVWQWCEDWYRADMNTQAVLDTFPSFKNDGGGQKYHLLRGAAWCNTNDPRELLTSSLRLVDNGDAPVQRYDDGGFRCVLMSGLSSR